MSIISRYRTDIVNSIYYKWWVYSAVALPIFLTVMDQTAINIALPGIANHFEANLPTVQWITLSYVLSTSAMVMPLGRLSDILGRKLVVLSGLLIFIFAAALGGIAHGFILIIIAKTVQGIGAAAIQANGFATILEAFPEKERGKAMGMYMTIIGVGSISGPIIGGLLISHLGWRSVFFTAIPFGIISLVAISLVLQGQSYDMRRQRRGLTFDWVGAALSSSATICVLLLITNAYKLGWDSSYVVLGLITSVILISSFIWWELKNDDPMLDLRLFKNRIFSLGVSARFFSFLGGSSVFFLMPFYLIQVVDYPANKAALLMIPGSLCMAVVGPICGRLSDKIGTKWLNVLGMALSFTAMITFSQLSVESSPLHIITGMVLSGSGMGMFNSTNTTSIMSAVDNPRFGIVSGFLNLARTSANLVGVALATSVVTITMSSYGYEPTLSMQNEKAASAVELAFVSAINLAFFAASGYALISLILSLVRTQNRVS